MFVSNEGKYFNDLLKIWINKTPKNENILYSEADDIWIVKFIFRLTKVKLTRHAFIAGLLKDWHGPSLTPRDISLSESEAFWEWVFPLEYDR